MVTKGFTIALGSLSRSLFSRLILQNTLAEKAGGQCPPYRIDCIAIDVLHPEWYD